MSLVELRGVVDADLDTFFRYQQNEEARQMAAFTNEDPEDRGAFDVYWERIRNTLTVKVQTIELSSKLVGHIASFDREDEREVTYWIDQAYWGQGVATDALNMFLNEHEATRPIFARVAFDNDASMAVLKKCAFSVDRHEVAYASARGMEIEESVFKLGTARLWNRL